VNHHDVLTQGIHGQMFKSKQRCSWSIEANALKVARDDGIPSQLAHDHGLTTGWARYPHEGLAVGKLVNRNHREARTQELGDATSEILAIRKGVDFHECTVGLSWCKSPQRYSLRFASKVSPMPVLTSALT
jgi:hypothetical protein